MQKGAKKKTQEAASNKYILHTYSYFTISTKYVYHIDHSIKHETTLGVFIIRK